MKEKPPKSSNSKENKKKPDELVKSIQEKNPKIFEGVPPEKKKEIIKVIRSITIQQESHHSGPLPTPADLNKYNEIIENGAERIMKMAEKQQEHRMILEKEAIRSQIKQSGRGQNYAFILSVFVFSLGGILIYLGHGAYGISLCGGALASIVSAFIYSKKFQEKDLREKDE